MSVQTLRSYFETPDRQREALADYFKAWGGVFSLSKEMLDHYDASQRAYDPLASTDEALRDFTKIYDELRGPNWQVFRPYSPQRDCCPPKQIFETIKREFGTFSWGGQVNLLTYPKSGTRDCLQSCLKKMKGIKPNRGYPHMTVSDDTETFLLYYFDWATSLLSVAHPTFMQVFVKMVGRTRRRRFGWAQL